MARKHTATQMRRHLALRSRHGLTWAELSARVRVPVSTLQWWSARLAAAEASDLASDPAATSPFVEVAVMDRPPQRSKPRLEIELPQGITIRVPGGFDLAEFREIFAAITSRC